MRQETAIEDIYDPYQYPNYRGGCLGFSQWHFGVTHGIDAARVGKHQDADITFCSFYYDPSKLIHVNDNHLLTFHMVIHESIAN